MTNPRILLSVAALAVAATLSLLSFAVIQDVTANMLILIAQFLVYSLTMAGLGTMIERIIKALRQ